MSNGSSDEPTPSGPTLGDLRAAEEALHDAIGALEGSKAARLDAQETALAANELLNQRAQEEAQTLGVAQQAGERVIALIRALTVPGGG